MFEPSDEAAVEDEERPGGETNFNVADGVGYLAVEAAGGCLEGCGPGCSLVVLAAVALVWTVARQFG